MRPDCLFCEPVANSRLGRLHYNKAPADIRRAEWERDVAPLVNHEAWLRGAPVRATADGFSVRLEGEWRSWPYQEAFVKLVPRKAVQPTAPAAPAIPVEAVPPGLLKMVGQ